VKKGMSTIHGRRGQVGEQIGGGVAVERVVKVETEAVVDTKYPFPLKEKEVVKKEEVMESYRTFQW